MSEEKKTPFKRGEVRRRQDAIKFEPPLYPRPSKDWDLKKGQRKLDSGN
jgi:hypothetical protein